MINKFDPVAYRESVNQNDLAHRREIAKAAEEGTLDSRYAEIAEEAKLWLRHLRSIHHADLL